MGASAEYRFNCLCLYLVILAVRRVVCRVHPDVNLAV